MITAPEVFGGTSTATSDPCPGYRKYVEVAFKCRPTQFREEKLRLEQLRSVALGENLAKNLAFICVNAYPSGRRWLATGNP